MKLIFCSFFLVLSGSGLSQPNPEWKPGSVVLSTGNVLSGEISCHPLHDVILFRVGKEVQVFPSHKIQLFRFYDEPADINRQFLSLRSDVRFEFFEVVVQGPVKVVRRPKNFGTSTDRNEITGYRYYSWDGFALEPLQKFKSRVYPRLIAYHPQEIKAFVAKGHLKLHEMKAAILIIKEYDRILLEKPLMASAF